jgi:hypothetical protein
MEFYNKVVTETRSEKAESIAKQANQKDETKKFGGEDI